jgi:predicted acyl esterase
LQQRKVAGDVNFRLASSAELLGFRGSLTDIQSEWFRQHVVPEPAANENDSAQTTLPPVLLFVMGINQWREEQEWPLSRAVGTDLFLRADGLLSVEPPVPVEGVDTYRYDPTDPVITTGGAAGSSVVRRRPDGLVAQHRRRDRAQCRAAG